MFRAHTSLPSKSNARNQPVPVMTHTCSPSVTGDGEDIFCFRSCLSLSLRKRFQITEPVWRSTRHNSTDKFSVPVEEAPAPPVRGAPPPPRRAASALRNAAGGDRRASFLLGNDATQRIGRWLWMAAQIKLCSHSGPCSARGLRMVVTTSARRGVSRRSRSRRDRTAVIGCPSTQSPNPTHRTTQRNHLEL